MLTRDTKSTPTINPVVVGLAASRLASLVNEQQAALVHTAFSPVVRESLDLACAVFDSSARMIAQSAGGTPGHINAMATGMAHVAAKFPASELNDGDVLITNDPWLTAGQINDLTVATPVFRNGALIAWFASCCHSPDIGGRILSAGASEVYEEGLRLPILKLKTARGGFDATLEALMRANVRTPDETLGDIYAQVAANQVGAAGLERIMTELSLDDIDAVADEIMRRSEHAMRAALAALPDGQYRAQTRSDGFGDDTLTLAVTVTVEGDSAVVDFAGSSPQSKYGINVVLNYAAAYTSFALKAALAPEVPNNDGSFRPVEVRAPLGSVLNCIDPAPVAARHLVGHFLPSLIFDAIRPAVPGGLPAPSCDAAWLTVWRGTNTLASAGSNSDGASSFTLSTFATGGSGGRPTKDGLSTTGFPTGVRAAPTEVLETLGQIVHRQRALWPNSAGPGQHRGGLGQILEVGRRGTGPWSITANVDRLRFPAQGAEGGCPGTAGALRDSASSTDLPAKQTVTMDDHAAVTLCVPGGGGYGDPLTRPAERVLADVVDGYVTIEAAAQRYGVEIEYIGDPAAVVRPPAAYRLIGPTRARQTTDSQPR